MKKALDILYSIKLSLQLAENRGAGPMARQTQLVESGVRWFKPEKRTRVFWGLPDGRFIVSPETYAELEKERG